MILLHELYYELEYKYADLEYENTLRTLRLLKATSTQVYLCSMPTLKSDEVMHVNEPAASRV